MNENIFSGKADLYTKCRPTYAAGAIELIRQEVPLRSDNRIADIGAGTGIFTEQLMQLGCGVAAVEPNPDMRSKIAETAPGAEIFSAPAEHTGLETNSISLITAAESFHWFDPAEFRAECRRILNSSGKVMLVWNLTDKQTDKIQLLHDLNLRFCTGYRKLFPDNAPLSDKKYLDMSESFLADYRKEVYANDLKLNKDQFIGNRISRSYAPKPGEEEYEKYRYALEEFFELNQNNGTIELPNNTICYIGSVH